MLDHIFDTKLYYYKEGTGELCSKRIALTYPWRTPHTRDILRWMCFDHECTPFSDTHPLSVLRLACSVLSMELSEKAYFFQYEDAVSRDMRKSFHSERYISAYIQQKIELAEMVKNMRKNDKLTETNPPVHKTKENCERLLKREEYLNYLRENPHAVSREMEFYYRLPKGEMCMLRASEWAPIEIKSGLWAYKPCIIDGEGNSISHMEKGEEPDPLHALIKSLQSITRCLVTYAEEYGISRYYVEKEEVGKKSAEEDLWDVSYLKFMRNSPVLWGLGIRMESTGELILD